MIIDKITELFTRKVGIESIGIFLITIFLCFVIIKLFIFTVKTCFLVEKQSGKPAHTLLKTILIAIVPTIYSVTDILGFSDIFPQNIIIPVCAVVCIIVSVWNIFTYGIIGGLMFSLIHIVFGVTASLGVSALIFIGFALVLLFLFAGGSSVQTSSSGSAPSLVRDVNNGQVYHVVKGVNGELYIEDHGRSSVLRFSDYSGEYFDDYGNRYK